MIYKTTAVVIIRSVQYTIVGGTVDDPIYYYYFINKKHYLQSTQKCNKMN